MQARKENQCKWTRATGPKQAGDTHLDKAGVGESLQENSSHLIVVGEIKRVEFSYVGGPQSGG